MSIIPRSRQIKIGDKFGWLEATSETYYKHDGDQNYSWCMVRCICGFVKEIRTKQLITGLLRTQIQSCGCRKSLYNILPNKSPRKPLVNLDPRRKLLMVRYHSMLMRCRSDRPEVAKYYKDKGIKVCPEWLRGFNAFYAWAISNGFDSSLSLDRIDGSKGYCPQNCRWATYKQQVQNRTLKRKPSDIT